MAYSFNNKIPFVCVAMLIVMLTISSCSSLTKIHKNPDYNHKLEVAKQFYAEGSYSNSAEVLESIMSAFRHTKQGDEAMFLLGMCKYMTRDYISASEILKRYYSRTYPKGMFVDEARFYSAKSWYYSTLPTKLLTIKGFCICRYIWGCEGIDVAVAWFEEIVAQKIVCQQV